MKITTNPVVGTWEKAESDASPGRNPALNTIPCQKNTLLIVDDEDGIRRVFQMVLAMSIPELKIDQANNGAKGVDAFRRDHHSIILMDLSMPVMDGETAYKEIISFCEQEQWALPSVVFCTGFNPSPSVRSVVAANPKHCMLQKPVRNQVLTEAIRARLV